MRGLYNVYPNSQELEDNLYRLGIARVLVLKLAGERLIANSQETSPAIAELAKKIRAEIGLTVEWLQKLEIERGIVDVRGAHRSEIAYLKDRREAIDNLIREKENKLNFLDCEG